MSQLKLTADSGGGTVAIKGPASTTGNAAIELTVPGTSNATLLTSATSTGKILQVVQTVKKDVFSETVASGGITGDITGLTVTITPSNASNKILLFPCISANSRGRSMVFYKDGSLITDAIADASGSLQRVAFGGEVNSYGTHTLGGMYLDTAGGTSAITYSLRMRNALSSEVDLFVNRVLDSDESHSSYVIPRYISTFTVMEVAA